MIKCHLAVLMGQKKMKISDVAEATGLNRSTITALYKETATRIDLNTIEALCLLFECKVGELLELTAQKTASQKIKKQKNTE